MTDPGLQRLAAWAAAAAALSGPLRSATLVIAGRSNLATGAFDVWLGSRLLRPAAPAY